MLRYHFNDANAKFRPYVGVGATYVWFTGAKITNGTFENGVLGGPTSATTSNQWAPLQRGLHVQLHEALVRRAVARTSLSA